MADLVPNKVMKILCLSTMKGSFRGLSQVFKMLASFFLQRQLWTPWKSTTTNMLCPERLSSLILVWQTMPLSRGRQSWTVDGWLGTMLRSQYMLNWICISLAYLADCSSNYLFSCPPRTFLPALCKIFLDEHAPNNVLEVTARAITYYLDVSAECTRRIIAVEGAVKALCNRLVVVEPENRTSKDLAEQCIKVSQ